ncbi:hypothetical protein A4S05_02715 [Nostoc sp. KVJ20]|uniref:hypothetical protein n=1 Tax=Nostoc sp. KVJ20 TaxID=457944 RepID=UPI00086A9095|nr:hypothetical protein [Nostoc sp. KVJ20]ODH02072.1 hypothetical protein A4S05_02715 [Nostoc sp. KVJ20]
MLFKESKLSRKTIFYLMNSCTLENYLQVVVPHLSPELVSPEALSHIQPIARIFPPSSEGLFECRLGADNSKVDFSVLATNFDGSHHNFGGINSVMNFPDIIFTNPIWRRIQDFCSVCCQPKSLLSKSAENIWLEFDLDEQPEELPIPSLFLGLKEFQLKKHTTETSKISDEQLQTITTVLQILFEHDISPLIEKNLGICVNSLPSGSQVLYVGAMFSRQLDAVRVNLGGIRVEMLEDYLAQIGWIYSVKPLKKIIKLLAKFSDAIILNLDIGTSIFPKIGLECLLENKSSRLEPKWQLLLDFLVEQGLCIPEKRDAVLNWSGCSHEKSYPELWSKELSKVSSFLGSKWYSICFRNLNHIKIIYHPDGNLEAKGYLAFGHRFVCKN